MSSIPTKGASYSRHFALRVSPIAQPGGFQFRANAKLLAQKKQL